MGEEEEVDYDDHHDDHHDYDWDVCFDETLWWWSWCTQRVRVVVSATFSTVQRKSKLHNKLTGFSELLLQNLPCLLIIAVPMLTNVNDHPTKKEGGQMHNWTFETFIAAPEISFLCQCSLAPGCSLDPGWNWSLKQFFCGLWRIPRRIFLVSSQGVLKLSEHYPHPNPEKRKSEKRNPFSMQQCKQPLIKLLMAMLAMMMKLIIMMMELTMLMPLLMMVLMLTMLTIRSLAKRGQTSAPT